MGAVTGRQAGHRFSNDLRYRDDAHPAQDQLTPAYVLDRVREDLGGVIELDPCTTPDNPVGALRFFAPPDDGAALPWVLWKTAEGAPCLCQCHQHAPTGGTAASRTGAGNDGAPNAGLGSSKTPSTSPSSNEPTASTGTPIATPADGSTPANECRRGELTPLKPSGSGTKEPGTGTARKGERGAASVTSSTTRPSGNGTPGPPVPSHLHSGQESASCLVTAVLTAGTRPNESSDPTGYGSKSITSSPSVPKTSPEQFSVTSFQPAVPVTGAKAEGTWSNGGPRSCLTCMKCFPDYTLSCFINPPYSRARERWVRRCILAGHHGAMVILLMPAATDTRCFQSALATASDVVFIRGRVKFGVLRPNRRQAAASHPSALIGWNASLVSCAALGTWLKVRP